MAFGLNTLLVDPWPNWPLFTMEGGQKNLPHHPNGLLFVWVLGPQDPNETTVEFSNTQIWRKQNKRKSSTSPNGKHASEHSDSQTRSPNDHCCLQSMLARSPTQQWLLGSIRCLWTRGLTGRYFQTQTKPPSNLPSRKSGARKKEEKSGTRIAISIPTHGVRLS
jgi:hypothetical protein